MTREEAQAGIEFRNERSQELYVLAEILSREGIMNDVSMIYTAAGSFKDEDKVSQHWRLALSQMEFCVIYSNDTQLQHIKPKEVKELYLTLTVDHIAVCSKANSLEDPFCFLQIDLEITGKTDKSAELPVYCAWHFDRLPHGQSGHFVHPIYHIQYGGDKVWNRNVDDTDYGRQLLLASPRIAHPPLDIILAVDFVLSNFFAEKWAKLRNDAGDYIELVKEAQNRYWRPYAVAMASHWENPVPFVPAPYWSPQMAHPQLLK